MTAATETRPKLSASQARKLEQAEVRAAKLKAELDEAEGERNELRARYKARLPQSDEPKDRGKNVCQAIAGGILVRVSSFLGGEYFSVADYREAGHTVTPEMQMFISRSPRERWTVKSIKGPKTSRAVEPA